MRDITSKQVTLRTARVSGIIFCSEKTIEQIKSDLLPKGNLFDVARAAGFLGAKLTPQLLPHCHPVSIDGLSFHFDYLDKDIHAGQFDEITLNRTGIVITAEAKSIGRTGIEMETLTAVSVAALEIYDMLKPVDTTLEIGCIRLDEKRGGKSDRNRFLENSPVCAVLVCSDSTAAGEREDRSGKMISEMLKSSGAEVRDLKIVPDDIGGIQHQITAWIEQGISFIFTTGGTGLGPRDNTVKAVRAIIDKDASAIAEAMRNYGQLRTPLAMMSQSVAGVLKNSLIITLPGSTKGAKESLEAILPAVFHAKGMIGGEGH